MGAQGGGESGHLPEDLGSDQGDRRPCLQQSQPYIFTKVEMELFQHYRVADFKQIIVVYLEELTQTQLAMVSHWEGFLPEIKRIA